MSSFECDGPSGPVTDNFWWPGSYLGGLDEFRVPTRPGKPGKPGKMKVHLENLEISWNFEKNNKYHGKMA